jgi:hypothetical protein
VMKGYVVSKSTYRYIVRVGGGCVYLLLGAPPKKHGMIKVINNN